jgi:hypothetical protein
MTVVLAGFAYAVLFGVAAEHWGSDWAVLPMMAAAVLVFETGRWSAKRRMADHEERRRRVE